MRYKRRLNYFIQADSPSWWYGGRKKGWIKEPKGQCSNYKRCRSFDSAIRAAKKVPYAPVMKLSQQPPQF